MGAAGKRDLCVQRREGCQPCRGRGRGEGDESTAVLRGSNIICGCTYVVAALWVLPDPKYSVKTCVDYSCQIKAGAVAIDRGIPYHTQKEAIKSRLRRRLAPCVLHEAAQRPPLGVYVLST